MGKLEKTKDNLSEIMKPAEESQRQADNRAELTLLSQTLPMHSDKQRQRFCKTHGIPWDEYQLLLDKWKHVIAKYNATKEERMNQNSGDYIANILDHYSEGKKDD